MSLSHTGKTALITGGAVGIGRGIALALASRGYNLAISHYHEEAQAQSLTRIVEREYGGACAVFPCDLLDAEAPYRLAEGAIRELGDLHVLVNNAGVSRFGAIPNLAAADIDHLMHLNFRAPLLMMQAVANHMIARNITGSIVHIASTRGERAYPGDAVYGGSKAALMRAAQSAALDLAPYGIRVNCIAPGATAVRDDEGALAHYAKLGRKIPLGRVGTPSDVGEAVAWLVSEHASYITGVTIKVDGGLILPGMPENMRHAMDAGWGLSSIVRPRKEHSHESNHDS